MDGTTDVSHPINHHEQALLEQGRRIRALHAIISRPDLSFEQQIDEILRLGCQLLGTEIGKVGKLDTQANTSEFLNTVVMSDLGARRGIVLPLDKTFCEITFSSPETLAISDVRHSGFSDHPAASFLGMQSYIGCSITVHGRKFGTVNFSNRSPVARPFTETDKDLVNLMGSWISVMMERQLEAEELKKSKEAAEAANQAKSAFLANMSHEIRTPLTVIIGYAETALDDDQSMAQRIHALRTIRQNSDHLLHLINDILDLSKIEAGELDIEATTAYPLQILAEVESIIISQAHRKKLAFSSGCCFPLPEKIISDPLRLKQILLNLCSNAIKFTDEGSVQINVSFDQENSLLKFQVIDTGIGMTEEQLGKIFRPFKQADASTTRRFGGSGLGLSLSSRLAKLLNGELLVQSEFGKGTTLELNIRIEPGKTEQCAMINSKDDIRYTDDEDIALSNYPLLQGSVLLVEDNEANRLLIKMYLEKMGADVVVAENGKAAISRMQQQQFDMVYMDMQMPVMSGIDAVKQLRKQGNLTPIVMLTANATRDDRRQSQQAGCDEFLTKPIVRHKLYEETAKYLSVSEKYLSVNVIVSELLEEEPEMADLVYRYIARLSETLTRVRTAYENQDWEIFRKLCHELKGTAGNYGFPHITEICGRLEEVCCDSSATGTMPVLLQQLQEVILAIQAGVESHQDSEAL